ncbi:MAG: CHRD domain-containing protein [Pyrinomonadaceae bacterium]|nr:CHRD domain-containing protein [Pyrinomonadaceae bacterium]MCX7640712.1 CHRD domain-containing protein [Pyrinomonadaceae bacterium]MDW8305320.1 CHRD domain-containing protein [Acidobacteriota bacterium]
MMKSQSIRILLSVLTIAFSSIFISLKDVTQAEEESQNGSSLVANLTGPAIGNVTPKGFARYNNSGGNRYFSVEVSNVNLPSGTKLSVILGNTNIGQITLSPMRNGRLLIQGSSAPTVNAGDSILITNASSTILSGTFVAPSTPSPSPTMNPRPSPSPSPRPTVATALFAPLTGGPIDGITPRGMAQYTEFDGGRKTLRVFVRQVNLPAGTALDVTIGNVNIGQIVLRATKDGSIRLDTANGDNVPTVTAGTSIEVRNGTSLVLSGSFLSPQTPSPAPRPTIKVFGGKLNGNQVVPPVTTQARGAILLKLNSSQNRIHVSLFFANLSSNQTSASINGPAIPGENAPVIFDLGAVGATSGHITATFDVTSEQVQQLQTGLWYVVVGSENNPNGEIRGQIRNFSRPSSFSGEVNEDLAVFRPWNSTWYFRNGIGYEAVRLGQPGDKIVAGDFDGDGRTDAAVFRNGIWQIRRSYDGSQMNIQWGLSTDTPIRGDFDGDGISDFAVFRPSNGMWYIRQSQSGAFVAYRFGTNGDVPIAADFDGDGRSDVSVFRPSNGTWYWLRSSDNAFSAIQFGVYGDIPLIADFDADGINDIAVFRPSNGTWYWLRSSDNTFSAMRFGISSDIPVAADFDADLRTDVAVFRPSQGAWYILRSSDNSLEIEFFGSQGDVPVASR